MLKRSQCGVANFSNNFYIPPFFMMRMSIRKTRGYDNAARVASSTLVNANTSHPQWQIGIAAATFSKYTHITQNSISLAVS